MPATPSGGCCASPASTSCSPVADRSLAHPSAPADTGTQLVTGLAEAFAVRAGIQRAVGVLMAREHGGAEAAYATLRLRAAAVGAHLAATAAGIVAEED